MAGIKVGDYNLSGVLGKGGFGTVYTGLDQVSGEFVAVKQVNLQKIPKDQLNGIMQEIDLLKNLNHANIVKYVKYVKTKEFLYIVLELIENGSLASIVKKFGKFPEPLLVVYVAQVLEGLVYLHEQGVVHRDIKGANILTTKEGVIKLADFGVATKFGEESASAVVGTPYWMAPEIIELSGATTKSDIWSVGCTVIELLTGQPPYYDLGPMPALFRIVQDDCPPLPEGISPALKDWLMQCFQKDPMLRISAQKLLKHKWIQGAKRKQTVVDKPLPTPEVATDEIQKYNKKIEEKSRIAAIPVEKAAPSPRPSMGAAVSMPPPEEEGDDDGNWDDDFDFGTKKLKGKSKEKPKLNMNFAPKAKQPSKPEVKLPEKKKDAAPLKLKSPRKPEPEAEDDWDADFKVDDLDVSNLKISMDLPPDDSLQLLDKKLEFDGVDDIDFGDFDAEPAKPLKLAVAPAKSSNGPSKPANGPAKLTDYKEDDDDEWDMEVGKSLVAKVAQPALSNKRLAATLRNPAPEDDDDIFANFEDELEDEVDFEKNVLKDNFARMSEQILKLMARLQPDASEEELLSTCQELITTLKENPGQKSHILRQKGVIPIMDMLEVSNTRVLHSILQVVNQLIDNNPEIQENLCLVGGIPAIMKFAGSEYSLAIRTECASFVSKMCSTSTRTLQMFIACRGLPVLVDFLKTPYEESKSLICMAMDAIGNVFELQSPTPKNDFCRLFSKCGLMRILAYVLKSLTLHPDAEANKYIDKIANLFLFFSAADSVVKLSMAQQETMVELTDVMDRLSPEALVKLLKSIRQLAMDHNTLIHLQRAGVIGTLVKFLGRKSGPHVTEVHNQALSAMYHLCRLDPERQYLAAVEGMIPHLQNIISANSPLKQFALPLICDLAHVKRARDELWKTNSLRFYLDLLMEKYWQVSALDAISVWLVDDPKRVSAFINGRAEIQKIVNVFEAVEDGVLANVLEPYLRIVSVTDTNRALGSSESGFVPKLLDRLEHPDPQVRVNLLKILTSLYECHPSPKRMIAEYKLFPVIKSLTKDKTVLVQKMASKLLTAFNANVVV